MKQNIMNLDQILTRSCTFSFVVGEIKICTIGAKDICRCTRWFSAISKAMKFYDHLLMKCHPYFCTTPSMGAAARVRLSALSASGLILGTAYVLSLFIVCREILQLVLDFRCQEPHSSVVPINIVLYR